MELSIDGRMVSKKEHAAAMLDDSKRLYSWITVNGVRFYASSSEKDEKVRIHEAVKAFEKLAKAVRKINWE